LPLDVMKNSIRKIIGLMAAVVFVFLVYSLIQGVLVLYLQSRILLLVLDWAISLFVIYYVDNAMLVLIIQLVLVVQSVLVCYLQLPLTLGFEDLTISLYSGVRVLFLFLNLAISLFVGCFVGYVIAGGKFHLAIKLRTRSLILSALYAASGVVMYYCLLRFENIAKDMAVAISAMTRAVFFPRSIGWVLIGFIFSVIILAKDKYTRARPLNTAFLIIFVCGLAFSAVALIFPIISEVKELSK
jgi:hypothetical protein